MAKLSGRLILHLCVCVFISPVSLDESILLCLSSKLLCLSVNVYRFIVCVCVSHRLFSSFFSLLFLCPLFSSTQQRMDIWFSSHIHENFTSSMKMKRVRILSHFSERHKHHGWCFAWHKVYKMYSCLTFHSLACISSSLFQYLFFLSLGRLSSHFILLPLVTL